MERDTKTYQKLYSIRSSPRTLTGAISVTYTGVTNWSDPTPMPESNFATNCHQPPSCSTSLYPPKPATW